MWRLAEIVWPVREVKLWTDPKMKLGMIGNTQWLPSSWFDEKGANYFGLRWCLHIFGSIHNHKTPKKRNLQKIGPGITYAVKAVISNALSLTKSDGMWCFLVI